MHGIEGEVGEVWCGGGDVIYWLNVAVEIVKEKLG